MEPDVELELYLEMVTDFDPMSEEELGKPVKELEVERILINTAKIIKRIKEHGRNWIDNGKELVRNQEGTGRRSSKESERILEYVGKFWPLGNYLG